MATVTQARRLYQGAKESGNWDTFGACIVELMKPPKPPKGKIVWPAPVMLTTFADGRACRMSVMQYARDPIPVDRAQSIARGIYRDHVGPDVPEIVSCEHVDYDAPAPENCGLIRWQPSEYSLDMLARWEQGDSLPEYWEKCLPDPVYTPWRDMSAPRYQQAA